MGNPWFTAKIYQSPNPIVVSMANDLILKNVLEALYSLGTNQRCLLMPKTAQKQGAKTPAGRPEDPVVLDYELKGNSKG
jgi:hypothetical protein